MIYKTAFDAITAARHIVGPLRALPPVFPPPRRHLSGLAYVIPTGNKPPNWILNNTTGRLDSTYGSVALPTAIGSTKMPASQSSDAKFSYVHLVSLVNDSTADVVIALQPQQVKSGASYQTAYTPVLQSWTFKPASTPQAPAPEAKTTVVTITQTAHQDAVTIEAPTAPPPVPQNNFPPLDPGFSYVLGIGETKYAAPGGNTALFTASGDSVGQSVPYITSQQITTGTPAIIVSGSTTFVPIPVTEMNDRWEYQKTQVAGPASDRIYFHTELRNLNKPGEVLVYDYNVPGGSGGGIPLEAISRGIVDLSTLGQAELWRAGAQAAGVSDENIKLATEAGAALATTVALVGVGTMLLAPTTAAAATLPAGAETVTLVAPAAAETATAATTTVAATTGAGGSLLGTAGAVAAKSVASAALGVGTSAIATEIKKLTGQLPPAPAYNLVPSTAPATAPAPSGISPLTLAAGVFAAVFMLKRS